VADDSNAQVDEDLLAPSFDARKRQKAAAAPDADFSIIIDVNKERILLRETEELKA
jgi:hypothetical protein